jgi:hypothetical protein
MSRAIGRIDNAIAKRRAHLAIERSPSALHCSICWERSADLAKISYAGADVATVCPACRKALKLLLAPPRDRGLKRRIRIALEALDRVSPNAIADAQLKDEIGPYATNTVKSLVAQNYVGILSGAGGYLGYLISPKGRDALARARMAHASR